MNDKVSNSQTDSYIVLLTYIEGDKLRFFNPTVPKCSDGPVPSFFLMMMIELLLRLISDKSFGIDYSFKKL